MVGRRSWSVVALLLVLSSWLIGSAHASAAPQQSGAPGPVSVSVAASAEPLTITPGSRLDTWLLVGNQGRAAVTVQLSQVALVAGFDGHLKAGDAPDPLWAGQVDLPAQVRVPAGGEQRVRVRLRVPRAAPPNLYLLGLAAQPLVPADPDTPVAVAGRLVTYLLLDAPGPRAPQLGLSAHQAPRIALGALRGSAQVANQGLVTTQLRGQVSLAARDADVLGTVPAGGDTRTLLPAGASRRLDYHWQAAGWWALVRPQLEVAYPTGSDRLGTVQLQGDVVLVLPWRTVVLAVGALAGLTALTWSRCGGRPPDPQRPGDGRTAPGARWLRDARARRTARGPAPQP